VFGVIVGALLVWKLGTVGVWGGWLLIAIGVVRAGQLVQSFINPVGTIIVSDKEVVLPRGLHRKNPVKVGPSDPTIRSVRGVCRDSPPTPRHKYQGTGR
jgi:hypothetical protein